MWRIPASVGMPGEEVSNNTHKVQDMHRVGKLTELERDESMNLFGTSAAYSYENEALLSAAGVGLLPKPTDPVAHHASDRKAAWPVSKHADNGRSFLTSGPIAVVRCTTPF